ncbi:MAG: TetR family transcriptional regulator [Acidimicrobiia bacterium]|nr:TetR family transcriptional regulator [Acidimicrobiia bacterium]
MAEENGTVATDGRTIGARALATRRRLLDATKDLLARDGVLRLRLVDVTREVGSSPASFYQYFTDIDDALLVLSDEVEESTAELAAQLEKPWTSVDDYAGALAFVGAYVAYWEEHGAVLRARNLKAEEGDARFRAKRSESQLTIMDAMGALVSDSVSDGRLSAEVDSVAAAAGMLAMLERLTSYRRELAERGTTAEALNNTLARILFRTVSGINPPDTSAA